VSPIGRRLASAKFLRFALVGTGGFVVDTSVFFVVHQLVGLDKYSARAISIFTAMNFTYAGNRFLTFREHAAAQPQAIVAEWARFLSTNALGALVNYGIYAAMVTFAPWPANDPYLALVAGVAAGLILNFTLSRHVVFRGSG
jgi:putative flippase GtrA